MKIKRIASFLATIGVLATLCFETAGPAAAADPPQPSKAGIATRVPWTTSRITGTPDPPLPYTTEPAFPSLKFKKCLDLAQPAGSDRFFVLEQSGKIYSFPSGKPDVQKADLVVDLKMGIEDLASTYAITFHPDYAKNRFCYVCCIKARNKDDIKARNKDDGSQIVRLKVADTDPPTIDPKNATTIITWLSGGHNGCCLKFGPDGYLYISTGDAAPANPPDKLQAGQDVTNLLSAILRIDVDHADKGRKYRIPSDNPFVDLEGARGEIWAYGFRNPWRMSFDRKTGDLWVGDVGWELWEMLDLIERGANYGWGVTEGNQSINPEWPRGPTPILPPTIDHSHTESSSITDGLTYYGSRLRGLDGHHIYSDYDTGKFWAFRWKDGKVTEHREISDTTHRVVGFGEDNEGEFYFLDHAAGTIHRMIPNAIQNQNRAFPRKLSESGLFADFAKQVPAAGVIPYSINAEPWADYALGERFVAVPNNGSVKPGSPAWSFSKDAVLVKTLSLDMEQGNPKSRRRVETQILHFDGSEWQPYSYRWNDEQTDALLLDATGTEHTFDIVDPSAAGGKRKQKWRFSGRAECQRCHNRWAGPPLAFNTPQLNREQTYNGVSMSQLEALALIGVLESPIATKGRPELADPSDPSAHVASRARAYLQVNCAHCHRLHAGGAVLSKMHYDVKLKDTNMVGWRPSQGTFGIHAAQIIAPGDPFRSVLLYRMSKLGGGRMPYIGSFEVDRNGIALMAEWLREIPREAAKDKTGNKAAEKIRLAEAAMLRNLLGTKQRKDQTELIDRLLSSTSGAIMLLLAIDEKKVSQPAASLAVAKARQHTDVRVRDLFERFLPPEKRIKRLGTVVRPEQILSLNGDTVRGRQVFFATAGGQCKNCHQIQKEGKELGPDLTTIGKTNDRAQLLESILEPSKRIDPKYVTYLVETEDGKLLTGLLVKKDGTEVVLRDVQNKRIVVPADQIEQLVPQRKSIMPELLFRDMTAQQVADLLKYLSSLK